MERTVPRNITGSHIQRQFNSLVKKEMIGQFSTYHVSQLLLVIGCTWWKWFLGISSRMLGGDTTVPVPPHVCKMEAPTAA